MIDISFNGGQFAAVALFPFISHPIWGSIGVACTGIMIYFSHIFSTTAIRRAYLSSDGKRLGFEPYTMLAKAGQKIEVPLGNAKVSAEPSKNIWTRVEVVGLKRPLLLSDEGTFYDRITLMKLLTISTNGGTPDSKEERIQWYKERSKKRIQDREKKRKSSVGN